MNKKIFIISSFLLVVLLLLGFLYLQSNSDDDYTGAGVIYIVRHAEKTETGDDPPLTAHGQQKAADLASYLMDKNIAGIYSTNFVRTKNTAKPLADKLGVATEMYKKNKVNKLVKTILKRGGNHLVVGHWGTANEAFDFFGQNPKYDTEEANAYDRILMIRYDKANLREANLSKY